MAELEVFAEDIEKAFGLSDLRQEFPSDFNTHLNIDVIQESVENIKNIGFDVELDNTGEIRYIDEDGVLRSGEDAKIKLLEDANEKFSNPSSEVAEKYRAQIGNQEFEARQEAFNKKEFTKSNINDGVSKEIGGDVNEKGENFIKRLYNSENFRSVISKLFKAGVTASVIYLMLNEMALARSGCYMLGPDKYNKQLFRRPCKDGKKLCACGKGITGNCDQDKDNQFVINQCNTILGSKSTCATVSSNSCSSDKNYTLEYKEYKWNDILADILATGGYLLDQGLNVVKATPSIISNILEIIKKYWWAFLIGIVVLIVLIIIIEIIPKL